MKVLRNKIEKRCRAERSKSRVVSRAIVFLVGLSAWMWAVGSVGAQPAPTLADNRRCLNCHGQAHIATLDPFERRSMIGQADRENLPGPDEPPTRPGLFLSAEQMPFPEHSTLSCVQCHVDAAALPHGQTLQPASCTTSGCHTSEGAAFVRGVHAEKPGAGNGPAPRCATCHGGHDILPPRDRNSKTYPINIVATCAGCHKQHATNPSVEGGGEALVGAYLDSVHGQLVTRGGLVVAATCADCHGAHEIHPAADERALVNRVNVPTTCGRCHVGINETYAKSVHAQVLANGDEKTHKAPVCTDCHTAHGITRTNVPSFMLDIVNECGECHDDPAMSGTRRATFYETYRASYHGQVTRLGSMRAARCSDCHGAHDIRPISDPDSTLHGEHRVQVCAKCHENATPSFALFDPHADYRDGARYPLLHGVWLYFLIVISAAFGFFGLHSIMWFIRMSIERKRNGPRPDHRGGVAIRRFTRINRVNHILVIISFFGLTFTGIPLFFSDRPWALTIADVFGGVDAAGNWHRFFAIMLMFNFVLHVIGTIRAGREVAEQARSTPLGPTRTVLGWLFGPHSLFPRWKDVKDCFGMWRWFFTGRGKPSFGRWTYWEKFDYWAEIIGTFIIGGSGLLLWFPELVANWLPGWVFNIAMVVHGYEALLAVGFIFTIHFFNAHLRLEKFPVDDVIFTGRVPEEEMKHERAAEYAHLVERNRLDKFRTTPAPRWQRLAAIVVGVLAMLVGTGMVVLIILGGLRAL